MLAYVVEEPAAILGNLAPEMRIPSLNIVSA
jgi:hypothetical protein